MEVASDEKALRARLPEPKMLTFPVLERVETKALETSVPLVVDHPKLLSTCRVASDQKGPQSPVWNPRCSTFSERERASQGNNPLPHLSAPQVTGWRAASGLFSFGPGCIF